MFLYELVTEEKKNNDIAFENRNYDFANADPNFVYRVKDTSTRRNLKSTDHYLHAPKKAEESTNKQHKHYKLPIPKISRDFTEKRHIIITGSIVFKNTDGYLSAELRSFMTLYICTTIIYASFCGAWFYYYKKYQELFIALNTHLIAILVLGFAESLLSYIFYAEEDAYNV